MAGADMTEKIRKRELKRLKSVAHRGRSDLYRYLYASYPDLTAQGFGTADGPSWGELVRSARNDGIKGRFGNLPTVAGLRRVFANVARDHAVKAAREAEEATNRERPPSRFRPTPDYLSASAPTSVPTPLQPVPMSQRHDGETEAEADARVEAQLAQLRQTIAERSGNIPPRKLLS